MFYIMGEGQICNTCISCLRTVELRNKCMCKRGLTRCDEVFLQSNLITNNTVTHLQRFVQWSNRIINIFHCLRHRAVGGERAKTAFFRPVIRGSNSSESLAIFWKNWGLPPGIYSFGCYYIFVGLQGKVVVRKNIPGHYRPHCYDW